MNTIPLTVAQAKFIVKILEYHRYSCEQYTKLSDDLRIIEKYIDERKVTADIIEALQQQIKLKSAAIPTLKKMEMDLITDTIKKFNGNNTKAATALQISRPTLRNKLKKIRK